MLRLWESERRFEPIGVEVSFSSFFRRTISGSSLFVFLVSRTDRVCDDFDLFRLKLDERVSPVTVRCFRNDAFAVFCAMCADDVTLCDLFLANNLERSVDLATGVTALVCRRWLLLGDWSVEVAGINNKPAGTCSRLLSMTSSKL